MRAWTSPVSRDCEVCGEPFLARYADVSRGKGTCCSLRCASRKTNWSRPQGLSRTATRRRARKLWMARHGGAEPICHCGKKADVHHRDGNPLNNADENLEPLCRSHHIAHENKLRQTKAANPLAYV